MFLARKHHPLKDVAAAGGWKSEETLLRCYQQPDEATMLNVVMDGAEPLSHQQSQRKWCEISRTGRGAVR